MSVARNRTEIGARFVPAIIRWHDPLPKPTICGEWIAIERLRRGMARRALAHALRWDEATLRRHEEDRALPSAGRLAQLRAVLGEALWSASIEQ
jgi:hypothetical protein